MDDPRFDEPFPFPRARWFSGLFWAAPVQPGLYGDNALEGLIMTTNHRPSLVCLGESIESFPVGVLAMEAGGLSPQTSVALDLANEQRARGYLKALPTSINPSASRILISRELARALGWQQQPQIEDFPIQVVPDDLALLGEYIADPGLEVSNDATLITPAVVLRLWAGLALWLGQALIFSIPLLIFGWQSLLWGIVSLLVGMIVLALFWRLLPGLGWFKGLVAGGALALVVGAGLSLAIKTGWIEILQYSFAFWIATTWMSVVLTGARYK